MATPQFVFTRNPSTKVSVSVTQSGLVPADSLLVLVGRVAAAGSTVVENTPYQVENYGDPVAAKTECDAKFGAGAEATEMVIAAIKANLYGGREPKAFPPIQVIPMGNAKTSADLEAALLANIAMPKPFLAVPFPATDAVANTALNDHASMISASDRGLNGQFGTFGIMAVDGTLAAATSMGIAHASEFMMYPWLRDTEAAKENKIHEVAAAFAAICATCGIPFLPLNDVKVGGLKAPKKTSDYHTSGDAGTVSLGLASGLVPLSVSTAGSVHISRSITAVRTVDAVEDVAYYDMQDRQTLYLYRKNAYALANQPRYAIAKASDEKLKALRSELIGIAKDFEKLEMFQHVDQLAPEFTVTRSATNRHAALYGLPVNVIPGFHNKGLGIEGTTKYDSFQL